MTIEVGSIEILPSGLHDGSGLAFAMFEATLAQPGIELVSDAPGLLATLIAQKSAIARTCVAQATAIVAAYGTEPGGAPVAEYVNAMWTDTFGNYELSPGDGDWAIVAPWSMGQGDGAGYEVDTGLGEFLVPANHKVRVDWHLRAKLVSAPDPGASLRARITRSGFGEAVGSGQTFGPIANEPSLDAGTEIRFEGVVYFTTGASAETIRMEFGGLDDSIPFSPFRGALSIMRVG
jgi:hypothetical protein